MKREKTDSRDLREIWALKGTRESLVLRDPEVKMDPRDPKADLVCLEILDHWDP